MYRTKIINFLIRKHNYKSYLEIGVNNPEDNYNLVECEKKECVDPYTADSFSISNLPDLSNNNVASFLTYRMTSDEFFSKVNKKYDLIFIDGLHTEEQSSRDLMNAMLHLNPGGKIVLHDSCPYHEEYQVENGEEVGIGIPWLGQVWKTIYKLGLDENGFNYFTLNYEPGVTIVDYSEKIPNLNYKLDLEYADAVSDEQIWSERLRLITGYDFIEIFL